jgi:dethiobiotin synthetase
MAPFFVTATGTDLGKTHVLCSVLERLRARSVNVRALKPVLSGFDEARPDISDSGRLLKAQGIEVNPATLAGITPWRFAPPLSPDMAARRAGVRVALEAVAGFCDEAVRDGKVLFVEGAGGVMSPLGSDFLNIDLIARLKARPLLVSGGYLGTISHTLTALEAMRVRGIEPSAIVLSATSVIPVPLNETRETLMRFQRTPVFCVEHGAGAPEVLVDLLSR